MFWWRFPTFLCEDGAYFFTPGQFPPQKHFVAEMDGKRSCSDRLGIVRLAKNCSQIFIHDHVDPMMDQGGTEFDRKVLSGWSQTPANVKAAAKPETAEDSEAAGTERLRLADEEF